MSQALAPAPPRLIAGSVRNAILPLGIGLLLFGLLFRPEISAAIHVWISNTAYNHCFLVIPLAAFLMWERRGALVGLAPRPWMAPALLALPIGLIWFVADRLGIMEGRQLLAMML